MARIRLGTSGGRMPEVGLELEKQKRADARATEDRKLRADLAVQSMLADRERLATQERMSRLRAQTTMAVENMRSEARDDLARDKLNADVKMFEADLESRESRFVISNITKTIESEADRAMRAADYDRQKAKDDLGAMYRYGTKFNPDKARWEPVSSEDMPPGIPEGGLEGGAFALRAGELKARMSGYDDDERKAQLRDAEKIGGYIERGMDRVLRIDNQISTLKMKSMDIMMTGEGKDWAQSQVDILRKQAADHRNRIDSYVAAKVALETDYGRVPDWATGKTIGRLKDTLSEMKRAKKRADRGDRMSAEKIGVIEEYEDRDIDEVIRFLETYVRNKEQYSGGK